MNLQEYKAEVNQALLWLNFRGYKAESDVSETPYSVSGLDNIRSAILALKGVPYIEVQIEELLNTWLFKNQFKSALISVGDYDELSKHITDLRTRLSVLKDIIDSYFDISDREDVLYIRLPMVSGFETLARLSNELKKAIEIPVIDSGKNGSVEIVGADEGSIILYVAVGTILCVKLVAGICWAGVLIKKKQAEARAFEAHVKTLDLKNEALAHLLEAQKVQIKNLLESEAQAIAANHYSHNDPETIERLKLSIMAMSDLIEKGTRILSMSKSEEIQKSFPDHSALSLIESTIKHLKEGEK